MSQAMKNRCLVGEATHHRYSFRCSITQGRGATRSYPLELRGTRAKVDEPKPDPTRNARKYDKNDMKRSRASSEVFDDPAISLHDFSSNAMRKTIKTTCGVGR